LANCTWESKWLSVWDIIWSTVRFAKRTVKLISVYDVKCQHILLLVCAALIFCQILP
jgi:hypothetical protein